MIPLWRIHFDHIYCIHSLADTERTRHIGVELARTGISDSGIFSFVYTAPDPWERRIAEAFPESVGRHPSALKFLNLAMAQARMLRESLALGYGRIMVAEDDVCFLHDLDAVQDALEAIPTKADVVQFDKFVDYGRVTPERYRLICKERAVNRFYFDTAGGEYYSGGCFGVMNPAAMRTLLSLLEGGRPRPIDILFQTAPLRRVAARKNVAIQRTFRDAMLLEYQTGTCGDGEADAHTRAYEAQGVRFEDYSPIEKEVE